MVCLDDSILVWAKFVELLLEELRLLVRSGFLIQDENVADVVSVDL